MQILPKLFMVLLNKRQSKIRTALLEKSQCALQNNWAKTGVAPAMQKPTNNTVSKALCQKHTVSSYSHSLRVTYN